MKPAVTPTPILVPLSLLFFCLTACGASRTQESPAPATAPAESEASEQPSSDAGAVPESSEARVDEKPKRAVDADMQAAEEESHFDDSEPAPPSAPTAPTATAGSGPGHKKKESTLSDELKLQILSFDDATRPEALSCAGAKPHQEAICSLAERICEMESPSTIKGADCTKAQQSCQKARKQYQAKCR